jgi:GNAT superfamily N-acetyltransferase
VTIRPPRAGDVPEVVRLIGEHRPEPADEESVRRRWAAPGFELDTDARIESGALATVESLDGERVWLDVVGHPSTALLDWAEARAIDKGRRLLSGSWVTNEQLLHELEHRGFRHIRDSQRMVIDLRAAMSAPLWPEGIEVRSLRPGNERMFHALHQETFEDSWEPIEESYDEWAHWLLTPPRFDPKLWFLAFAGDDPVGFAISYPHPGDSELGWIAILGVRRSARNRGLGRALLLHAFAELRRRGMTRAALGVDAESLTGANRLYEQVGMRVSARFEFYEKAIG